MLGRDNKTDRDLLAIGPRVARVAAPGLVVVLCLALEVRRGDVVKQHIEPRVKQFAVHLAKMREELLAQGKHRIQSAVQTVVIDLLRRHCEQIIERRLAKKRLGDGQIAGGLAKPRDRMNSGHRGPRDLLATRLHVLGEELIQAQPLPQRQRQIDIAEPAQPLDTNAREIDRGPLWRIGRRRREKIALMAGRRAPSRKLLGNLLPPHALLLIERGSLTHRGDRALTRPATGADRLDNRPRLITLAVLATSLAAKKSHGQRNRTRMK